MLGLRAKARPVPDALQLTPRLNDIVFGHIPKTAGTSMRNALVEALPDAAKFFDYGETVIKARGDVVNAVERDGPLSEAIIALRSKMARRRPILLSGHFPLQKFLGVFHPASFVTFLRDPVDRVVSAYKHHVRHMDYRGGFTEFCEMPRHMNLQSRMLYGLSLHNIGFIGLTEQMPDMLDALAAQFDLRLRPRNDNVSKDSSFTLSADDRRRVARLNDDDMQLYEHVKANLADYTNLRERKFATPLLARGIVKHFRNGLFRGVVLTAEPGRLATIEVQVDGQVVHRCYADEYRAQPADKAVPGRWGFTVELPPPMLGAAAAIRFVLAGSEKDLSGSPFRVENGVPISQQKDEAD